MDKKIARAWAQALRSGDYDQAQGQLRIQFSEGNKTKEGFCCLGVLCNLHAQAHPEIAAEQTKSHEYMGESGILPWAVAEWAGMLYRDGSARSGNEIKIRDKTYSHLADANDLGRSFTDIADWIERNYQTL